MHASAQGMLKPIQVLQAKKKEFKTLNKDKKRYTVDSGDAEMSVLSH